MVRYESQKTAYPYFVGAAILFAVQIFFGLVLAAIHIEPSFLQGTVNFNAARGLHLNFAVFWILMAFVGTAFYATPLLSDRELHSPRVARWLAYAFVLVAALTLVIGLTLPQQGIAGWWLGVPWLYEGLEYIEGGRLIDILILGAFVAVGWNVARTFPDRPEWNEIHWILFVGLVALAFIWLFGMFFVPSMVLQEYFRWFVVHYWVEATWELIALAVLGYFMYLFFDLDIEVVGKYAFWEAVLVLLSGLIGNAHHYFWIGTPEFWQLWGGLFSALEPLPMMLIIWNVHQDIKERTTPLTNKVAFYFLAASPVLEFTGAGLLGFSQTFALTNFWEHGTWVTPAHGHMAMFGTFGMIALGGMYAALPDIKDVGRFDQRYGKVGFWLVFLGLMGIVLAFALGGTIQVYVYRIVGLDWFGGEVRPAFAPFRVLLAASGTVFALGTTVIVYDVLTFGQRTTDETSLLRTIRGTPKAAADGGAVEAIDAREDDTIRGIPVDGWWQWLWKPFTAREAWLWLGLMVLSGLLVTGGLLLFNLPYVQAGHPLPVYLAASLGYPGLVLTAAVFHVRMVFPLAVER